MPLAFRLASSPLRHICETFETIGAIHRTEGWRNLFRGLLPQPRRRGARPGHQVLRLRQLQTPRCAPPSLPASPQPRLQTPYGWSRRGCSSTRSSLDCTAGCWTVCSRSSRTKVSEAFYRGLSASYLGTLETVVHLVLYERLKTLFRKGGASASGAASSRHSELSHWASTAAAAGCAKVAAVLITYPHEVSVSHATASSSSREPGPGTTNESRPVLPDNMGA
ncbi:Mitochondrial substrate carrier [Cordyceps javanica]|nr:Mitochondrial substrate carrier [Cordyceps javanica]